MRRIEQGKSISDEVQFSKELLERIAVDDTVATRIRQGTRRVHELDAESGAVVFGYHWGGKPRISCSEFMIGTGFADLEMMKMLPEAGQHPLVSLRHPDLPLSDSNMERVKVTKLLEFHFHPVSRPAPSQSDVMSLVKDVVHGKEQIALPERPGLTPLAHRKMISGIIAMGETTLSWDDLRRNPTGNLKCFFFGLGESGLTSTEYQMLEYLGEGERVEALNNSGIWTEEGSIFLREGSVVEWDRSLIDRLSLHLG